MTESISVVAWGYEWQMVRDRLQRDVRKLLGLMNMFIILTVVMVSQVNIYGKTHCLLKITKKAVLLKKKIRKQNYTPKSLMNID